MLKNEVEVSWFLGLRLWWAWFWRTMLVVLFWAVIVGTLLGFVGYFMGVDSDIVSKISGLAGAGVAFYVMPLVFKRLISKGFGRYRLAVLEKE